MGSSPFDAFQPYNLVVFLSFFSPIILVLLVLAMSFFFQSVKGVVYLGFLMAVVVLRGFILQYSGSAPDQPNLVNPLCNSVKYVPQGNATFSTFVFAFTIVYLLLPMFQNGYPNWVLFSILIFYFLVDMGIKITQGCFSFAKNAASILGDLLSGAGLAACIISLMYLGGSGKYLFFSEMVSSDSVTCSMPKKQTFKCAVYKNGELISNL
jgi:hypothetical protein